MAATADAMGMPDMTLGFSRSMVTMMQFNGQKEDYVKSVAEIEEGTDAYKQALEACHQRGADRCVQVAEMHRGIYVKAAQFIASIRGGTGERGVPKQYTKALSKFTDQAPSKALKEVVPLLKECLNLGNWPESPLDEATDLRWIAPEPLAAGSLAQVHQAELRDGRKVAVKVQYPELRREMSSDFAVFKTMGATIKQMASGYDLTWVVEDFERNLARELDFELEAGNAEVTAAKLAHLAPRVYVPTVIREHTTKSVLTMEYCEDLLKVNDVAGLRAQGLDPDECAALICETFAEMIFVHGRVHADPHAGNIYFRVRKEGGRTAPQLVILDHGLYFDLSENDVRRNFCRYWKACCCKDSQAMLALGQHFAGALHRFLPVILSPWFIFGGEGVALSEIMSAAKGELPDTIGIRDVADFVVATREGGANLIGLLHSLGYTRGLLEELGFSERRRVETMLKFAILGDSPSPPQTPPTLSTSEEAWVRTRVRLLDFQIRTAAALARPALCMVKADIAPSSWALVAVPVLIAGLAVGGALVWRRQRAFSTCS